MASDQRKAIFAKRLKEARERGGFESAEQFATRIGLDPKAYAVYEREDGEGPEAWPPLPRLLVMCGALGVTPNELFGYPASASEDYTTKPNGLDIQNKIDELYHLTVVANQVVNGGIRRANLDTAVHLLNLLERSASELRKCLIQFGPFYAKTPQGNGATNVKSL